MNAFIKLTSHTIDHKQGYPGDIPGQKDPLFKCPLSQGSKANPHHNTAASPPPQALAVRRGAAYEASISHLHSLRPSTSPLTTTATQAQHPSTTTQPQPAARSRPSPPSLDPPPPLPSVTSVAGSAASTAVRHLCRRNLQVLCLNLHILCFDLHIWKSHFRSFEDRDMNIGTPGDISSHSTPSVADSTSPIFCSHEESSERPMDFVDPSINEELDDIENTDMIATDDDVQKPKRGKTSQVWKHFEEGKDKDGLVQLFCIHCKNVFKKPKTGATSHLGRHLKSCSVQLRAEALEERGSLTQSHISFPKSKVDPSSVPAFDGKFDMEKVKVEIAKWIMIHEYAFSAVDDEWFTIMMKRTNPEFVPMSRTTIRNQCVKIYENEKKKLKNEFKYVNKMSITTDCWKSKNHKIEYLAITGVDIANVIWRYLEDWGIEGKIHTVSVDNASANDSAIENLKVFIRSKKKLLCGGSLFHVRCRAHILNLVAQDGLSEIKNVIECVRDSVYMRRSDSRLKVFTEIVKQLNLRERKLIDDFAKQGGTLLTRSVLDPRYKMMTLEFFFPKLYSPEKTVIELAFVHRTLYDLYSEYVSMCSAESNASGSGDVGIDVILGVYFVAEI
ncbi:hypothetical protein BUALT_Bualt19G0052300 [Buddleja alternifolia]|uniref:BED-type domain-containing protein n=1 Tax=Buddleja alternifolia TaxID=168488 RepID=A0AAV6W1T9_9LAMI|nr:hypothetical protein BUALT_Bualt19G0052300 [Buddleja alternifolia]